MTHQPLIGLKILLMLLTLSILMAVKPASASMSASAASLAGDNYNASRMIDGDLETKWISASQDPQWLEIDAGEIVRVRWDHNPMGQKRCSQGI